MTIPGIGPVLSVTIVAEIGEIERFDNKKQVVSYAVLDPRVRQSDEKETTDAITKEGPPQHRWALGQAVLNVVKYDSYSALSDRIAIPVLIPSHGGSLTLTHS